MSTDKEINGIINRDELIDRLVEKKRKIEKMLKVIMPVERAGCVRECVTMQERNSFK